MDLLIVVDMQNDFVSGALGTKEAVEIVPDVVGRVVDGMNRGETILFTRDTHEETYMETQEGRNLPIPHCIRGSEGWEIIPQLTEYTLGRTILDKPTFGSAVLGELLADMNRESTIEKITLIGLCTDICVVSNALMLKAHYPENNISVDANCCAGVTPKSHNEALATMGMCQIDIK